MSAKDALIENPITLTPHMAIQDVLKIFEDHHIRMAPVLDDQNNLVGVFGFHHLMQDLLPMAAQIEDGLEDLDFVIGGAPAAAKRIRKLGPKPVSEHMDRDIEKLLLNPDTPLLEVIRCITRYGSPLPVVEDGGRKFVGLVSEQSCLHRLHEILKDVEIEERNNPE